MPAFTQAAFISYSRDDSKFARRLAHDLSAAGAFVWLDEVDIQAGNPWDDAIELALSQAPQMIVILSPASVKSNNVRDEISFALNKGKAVIPVLYKECELPLRLQRSQQIDFRNNYDDGLAALLRHLEANPSQVAPPASSSPVSRRGFVVAGTTAAAAVAGGAWLAWPRLSLLWEPLPPKRFVALMAWPNGDLPSVVTTLLDSIGTRLARAEAKVKDLLIVASSDLPAHATAPTNPAQVVSTLGANLVLAATLRSTSSSVSLYLQILDATTQRVLRKTSIVRKPAKVSELAEAGSIAAEQLLGLPNGGAPLKDEDELKSVSPQVFQLYSDAEQLVEQPNHTGLQDGIHKYEQAVFINTRFALGFARLAMAYTQQYLLNQTRGTIQLADDNSALAVKYNSASAKAQLSRGLFYLYSGEQDKAFDSFTKSLQADPGNPETLIYQAQGYQNAGKWPQAEKVYRDILNVRPNYWLAHDELGWVLNNQAKYKEAAAAFETAASAAPKVALPLASLGAVYMELGRHDDARIACLESLKRGDNEAAYMTLGGIAFSDGKYSDALRYYTKASTIDGNSHTIYRDIADCNEALGQTSLVQFNYAKAAQLLSNIMASNSKSGHGWAVLAFYYAKTGNIAEAENCLKTVKTLGTTDLGTQFYVVQALALLGKNNEALNLLLTCLDQGLAPIHVDLAVDLKTLQKDPRYVAHVRELKAKNAARPS